MRRTPRLLLMIALGLALAALRLLGAPAPASASWGQLPMIEDDPHLRQDPVKTLSVFRLLGARMVRVFVPWTMIAPNPSSQTRPSGFDAANPASYPQANWTLWDTIVREARKQGIAVDFTVAGGAPLWADAPGRPKISIDHWLNYAWKPSGSEYGSFVHALGIRYSGNYDPTTNTVNPGSSSDLPRVKFWVIWNEPNFGEDLAPQAINGSTVSVAPSLYRTLVNHAWTALHQTGHGNDTILIGGLSARGLSGPVIPGRHPEGLPGNFAQTKPLQFIRTLYCVDSNFHQLRGGAAAARGCPTTAAGSRQFRTQNPALFQASAFSQHPYPLNMPPTQDASNDPDYATFPQLPNLEHELDRLQHIYGSNTRFGIINDEYGYITHPPNPGNAVSPSTGAYYINWAEYLSWRSARIKSTMQYLLYDPIDNTQGGFASALLTTRGAKKPAYFAYRLPLYLPSTSTRRGRSLEVWGDVRPFYYASLDTSTQQVAQIQFQRGSRGPFTTIKRVMITDPRGYFDVQVKFPASGTVRLTWTYPVGDSLFPSYASGVAVHSRSVQVTLH
jgi:hypothetical protein